MMSRLSVELVGMNEMAERLGASRQWLTTLSARPGFPQPLVDRPTGRLWDWCEIHEWWQWHKRTNQVGRPHKRPHG